MKLAILQMADTPHVESSAVMLRYAGHKVRVCSRQLCDELRRIGCDQVVHISTARSYGCDPLDQSIGEATLADMERCDLFADIKVNNIALVKERWPRLRDRICFWRLNGGRPEHVIRKDGTDCGDEWFPGCPAITANLWYNDRHQHENYTFWPPYPRAADFSQPRSGRNTDPFCLVHGLTGWGYNCIVPDIAKMGVKMYGAGTPSGIVQHAVVPELVRSSLCMVHLKTTDCPGWALYEAVLGRCPVVVSRMLVARSRMEALFDSHTCIMFGPPGTPDGSGDMGYEQCKDDIRSALSFLRGNPSEASALTEEAHKRLNNLMWTPERDGPAFKAYLERTFP